MGNFPKLSSTMISINQNIFVKLVNVKSLHTTTPTPPTHTHARTRRYTHTVYVPAYNAASALAHLHTAALAVRGNGLEPGEWPGTDYTCGATHIRVRWHGHLRRTAPTTC